MTLVFALGLTLDSMGVKFEEKGTAPRFLNNGIWPIGTFKDAI